MPDILRSSFIAVANYRPIRANHTRARALAPEIGNQVKTSRHHDCLDRTNLTGGGEK